MRIHLGCQAEVFVLILANAAHVKNVPGRKSDVNDAESGKNLSGGVEKNSEEIVKNSVS